MDRVCSTGSGHALLAEHRCDDAEKMFLEALAATRRVLCPRHRDVGNTLYKLASVAAGRGCRAQALDLLRQAVKAGYDNRDDIAHDPYLTSLHGGPEFERLVTIIEHMSGAKPNSR